MKKNFSLYYYTDSTTFGGAERFLEILINEISDKIPKIAIVGPDAETLFSQRVPIKTDFYYLNPIKSKFDLLNFWKQFRFFKDKNPQILHVNLSNPYHSQFTIIAAHWAGVKHIILTHHLPTRLHKVKIWGRYLERFIYKNIDIVTTVSENGAEDIRKYLPIRKNNLKVIYNGIRLIDTKKTIRLDKKAILKEFSIPDNSIIIGGIGRFTPQKGFSYLIESLYRTPQKIPIYLFLVGDGPDRLYLESLAHKYSLTNVIFPGHREDIYNFINSFDIFILPSLYENFPFVLLEAMLLKTPIIATNVNGIPEMITHNQSGLLIPHRNINKLVDSIQKLIDNPHLAQRLGNNAFDTVNHRFNAKLMSNQYLNIYQDIF